MAEGRGVTADGSPVEVYLRLPTGEEPVLIHDAIPAGAGILELGCGTGRITHRLLELGHPVTAVDQSADMLAHVRNATTVLADIEELDLGRSFDAVVLASHLINVPDQSQRRAFLKTCRKHVTRDGLVLIERYAPDFDWQAKENVSSELGSVVCTLRDVTQQEHLVRAVMEYRVESRVWSQAFTAELLNDEDIQGELSNCALNFERWLDTRRSWLLATAIAD